MQADFLQMLCCTVQTRRKYFQKTCTRYTHTNTERDGRTIPGGLCLRPFAAAEIEKESWWPGTKGTRAAASFPWSGTAQPPHTHTLKLRSSSGDNRKKPDRDSSSVAGPLLGFLAVFRATYCFCARSGACCISNFPSQRPIIQRKQVCVFTAEGFAVRFFSEVEASLNLNLRPELVGIGSTLLCRWLKQSKTCLMQSKR